MRQSREPHRGSRWSAWVVFLSRILAKRSGSARGSSPLPRRRGPPRPAPRSGSMPELFRASRLDPTHPGSSATLGTRALVYNTDFRNLLGYDDHQPLPRTGRLLLAKTREFYATFHRDNAFR